MPVLAISFDADQTLWDFADVHRRALEATVAAMESRGDVKPGQVTTAHLRDAREEVMAELCDGPHDFAEVRKRSFALVLSRTGHASPDAAAAVLIDHYMRVRFDSIRLYDDVVPVLVALKGKTRLGLLTNGNTDPERCGLAGFFDAVVMGPSVGVRKPEPAAFDAIARALDVNVSDLWHVGDGADDIDGANAVGATSVFIDREGAEAPQVARADHCIRSLDELIEIDAIKNLVSGVTI